MIKNIKQAFTLVELIVVVTILAILATIGFVSYSGYLTGVRDTNRVASLTAISDGLELYRTKNDLPLPDNNVEIQVEGETIARQGYAGSNVLQTIEYSKAGKDPKDDQYYSYYLTDDKKHYQMMAFLEESDNLETRNHPAQPHPQSLSFGGEGSSPKLFSNYSPLMEGVGGVTFAATDYSNRHPKVYGKRLGILIDDNNTPIQEISTIKTAGNLNFSGSNGNTYLAIFADSISKSGTGKTLLSGVISSGIGKNYKDCNDILSNNISSSGVDGEYIIKIRNQSKTVYCDMTTNSGGWTRIDTEIKNETERLKMVEFIRTSGHDFGGPITNTCLECGNFPQYMRNYNTKNTFEFFCKYKLDMSENISNISTQINNELKNHMARDGLFIDGNGGTLTSLGLRSESQNDYEVYEEIYCK